MEENKKAGAEVHPALTRTLAWVGNLSTLKHSRTNLPGHLGSCRGPYMS